MAPLPENSTPRLFLDYTSQGIGHTLLVRPGLALSNLVAAAWATAIATACKTRMSTNDSFLRARYSPQGSNFSIDVPFTPLQGDVNPTGATWGQDPESSFLTIPGRSNTSGRRVRFCFFSPIATTQWPLDNRYNPGESAPMDTWRTNVIDVLQNGLDNTVWAVAIDGFVPTWYSYVNISQNAYWQRKQRG